MQTNVSHHDIQGAFQLRWPQDHHPQLDGRGEEHKEQRHQNGKFNGYGGIRVAAKAPEQALCRGKNHWVNLSWRIDVAIEAKASLISSPSTSK